MVVGWVVGKVVVTLVVGRVVVIGVIVINGVVVLVITGVVVGRVVVIGLVVVIGVVVIRGVVIGVVVVRVVVIGVVVVRGVVIGVVVVVTGIMMVVTVVGGEVGHCNWSSVSDRIFCLFKSSGDSQTSSESAVLSLNHWYIGTSLQSQCQGLLFRITFLIFEKESSISLGIVCRLL